MVLVVSLSFWHRREQPHGISIDHANQWGTRCQRQLNFSSPVPLTFPLADPEQEEPFFFRTSQKQQNPFWSLFCPLPTSNFLGPNLEGATVRSIPSHKNWIRPSCLGQRSILSNLKQVYSK